jgi:hypothetical protein
MRVTLPLLLAVLVVAADAVGYAAATIPDPGGIGCGSPSASPPPGSAPWSCSPHTTTASGSDDRP